MSEIVRDIQGFSRGERSSIGGHSVTRGYGCILFYEMETQAAACGFLPAEIFMHYVMFATLRIETRNEIPILTQEFLSESNFQSQIEHSTLPLQFCADPSILCALWTTLCFTNLPRPSGAGLVSQKQLLLHIFLRDLLRLFPLAKALYRRKRTLQIGIAEVISKVGAVTCRGIHNF